jgi:antitoxin MazE
MKVAKWGNSLAVRLPADVAEALDIKEGDDLRFTVEAGKLMVETKLSREELIRRLDALRRPMPAGFKFDRDEANAR